MDGHNCTRPQAESRKIQGDHLASWSAYVACEFRCWRTANPCPLMRSCVPHWAKRPRLTRWSPQRTVRDGGPYPLIRHGGFWRSTRTYSKNASGASIRQACFACFKFSSSTSENPVFTAREVTLFTGPLGRAGGGPWSGRIHRSARPCIWHSPTWVLVATFYSILIHAHIGLIARSSSSNILCTTSEFHLAREVVYRHAILCANAPVRGRTRRA